MKLSTKNSVEPEVKQMTKVLETLRDSEEETAISNANFIALSEDLRGREEQEKYTEDKQTKELVERLIQLLQNEIDSNRQVVKK
jgi:hypothetical protein